MLSQFRIVFGFMGMLLFGISILLWITLVVPPMMTGGQTDINLGTLTFWTVLTLIVWRLGGGKGWGFAAPSAPRVGAPEE